MPKETKVIFRWSSSPSIFIKLPRLIWFKRDIEEIESSVNPETVKKYYFALERAKEKAY
ncbi:MAG: hypothetical protein N2312_07110 [Dictyoglomaceae bacterium]|nr:hypothetical protein [Dictyoglomaceae bacterium]